MKKKEKKLIYLFSLFFWIFVAFDCFASNEFALTITPPLIKVHMMPGETWVSSIKFVNNNPITAKIYAQVVDFKSGEDGGVKFIKPEELKGNEKFLLSKWLTTENEMIEIAPFTTKEIPIKISVPETGEPGGHYAAVLAGTKPNEEKTSGSTMKISSMIASLIMVSVKGDIKEEGNIREFFTDKTVYFNSDVNFILRFENSGNIHLLPRGDIRVYNMFGQEKGSIGINKTSEFGNVLPESSRKWEFNWKGENSFFHSGRYRAEIVLSFGESAKQTATDTVYFWVIDLETTIIILGSIILFLLLIFIFMKISIKKAVAEATTNATEEKKVQKKSRPASVDLREPCPLDNKEVNKNNQENQLSSERIGFLEKLKQLDSLQVYKISIITLSVILIIGGIIAFFVFKNNANKTQYALKEIAEIKKPENQVKIETVTPPVIAPTPATTSNETEKNVQENATSSKEEIIEKVLPIKIYNGSGKAGVASSVSKKLLAAGVEATVAGNAKSFDYAITAIKCPDDFLDFAKKIKNILEIGSISESENKDNFCTIIVGSDYK